MTEGMQSQYMLTAMVAMHAIINKLPATEDSDFPSAVADGAADYASALMERLHGDDWQSR